jgi:hypothetical protein
MAVDSSTVVVPWIVLDPAPKVIAPRHRGDTRTLALGANWRYRARRDGGVDMVMMLESLDVEVSKRQRWVVMLQCV